MQSFMSFVVNCDHLLISQHDEWSRTALYGSTHRVGYLEK